MQMEERLYAKMFGICELYYGTFDILVYSNNHVHVYRKKLIKTIYTCTHTYTHTPDIFPIVFPVLPHDCLPQNIEHESILHAVWEERGTTKHVFT